MNFKCLYCGEDNEIEIINVSNNSTKDHNIAIEMVDLTKDDDDVEIIDLTSDDEIPLIDLTKEEDNEVIDLTLEDSLQQYDTDHSIIEYIIKNGDNIFNNGEFELNEETNNIRGVQYPRTTMDNCIPNRYLDGYWSPRSFFDL